ncbi:hypothetical protein CEXT_242881 [Caerostris extrusa]|uniref:Secreted protein n=1 Tax=Caerostris extrusa TaxID=172846 RepID=A0AAV4P049_CAEEX|nr:hypothetical protein CEXT_242881 [Caerostris extrusa]
MNPAFTARIYWRMCVCCHFSRRRDGTEHTSNPHAYSPRFIIIDWLLRIGPQPTGHVFSSSRSFPSFVRRRGRGGRGGRRINAQKHVFGECLCLLNGRERNGK